MFFPTHRHADGGFYQRLGPQKGKSSDGPDVWVDGVAYRNEEGMMFWTDDDWWAYRFEQIPTAASEVSLEDEDQVIASFKFQIADASDVRYMLVTAGAGAGKYQTTDQEAWLKRVLFAQAEMVTAGLHVRSHDFPDLVGDVAAFHAKFGQEYKGKPRLLPEDLHDFRIKFHDEETTEYRDEYPLLVAAVENKDRREVLHRLEKQLDALADAAWVILGTADLQFGRGNFYEAWRRVVKANMAKIRKDATNDGDGSVDSGRAPKYDIVKPKGWLPPDHSDLITDNAIFDSWEAEETEDSNPEIQA